MGGNRERDDEGCRGTTGQGALHALILPQREKPTILMGGTPEEVEGRLQGEGRAPPTQADCSPPPGPGGRALPTRSCLLQSALRNLPAQSRVPAQPQQLRPGAPVPAALLPGPAPGPAPHHLVAGSLTRCPVTQALRSLIFPETASLAPHTFAWVFPPSPWSTHMGLSRKQLAAGNGAGVTPSGSSRHF